MALARRCAIYRERSKRAWGVALTVLMGVWLSACSESTRQLTAAPEALQFEAVQHDAVPGPRKVKASFVKDTILAGYPPSTTPASWLSATFTGRDALGANFDFEVTTTDLLPGTYTTVTRLLTSNADGSGREFLDIPVTYVVSAQQAFSVSPAQLSFTATSGQALPAAQDLSVNGPSGTTYTLMTSYAESDVWLEIIPTGTPRTVRVRPSTSHLAPGHHTAVLTFTPDTGGAAVNISVAYTVLSSPFTVLPGRLDFTTTTGQSELPATQTLVISRGESVGGYSTRTSYAETGGQWLTLYPGATPDSIVVRPTTTSLAPGRYTARVTFTPDGGHPSVTVLVTYTVSGPGITASPAQLTFSATSGQSAPPPAQTVNLSTRAGYPVGYSVSASYADGDEPWLSVPSGGTAPQSLSIRPTTAALPQGRHTAVLTFTPDNGQPAARLTVAYTLSAPDLTVSPSAPALRVDSSTVEAALSTPLALGPTGAALDWRVVDVNVGWLGTSAVSGNTATGTGINLVVSREALATLANGTYPARITLGYGNASTPERQLEVTFSLTVALPRARIIMPYATEAGRSLSHVIRGNVNGLIFSYDGRRLFGFAADYDASKEWLRVFDVSGSPSGGQFPRLSELEMVGAVAGDAYSRSGAFTPDGRTFISADRTRFHVFPIPAALQ